VKKMKSVLFIFLSLLISSMFYSTSTMSVASAQTKAKVKIGTYIKFGKYNGQPILWRVIHNDENGNPVLFADRILSIKAFDASGNYHFSDVRRISGSNYYPASNLRQWLNSTSQNRGNDRIDWIQNAPSKMNMFSTLNSYDQERGFLAYGNFTVPERNLLKPVTHRVLLSYEDAYKKDGGWNNHGWNADIDYVVQNYDSARYKNVSDLVFLLSVKQLKEWVYDNRSILGPYYLIAKPTEAAVQKSNYKNKALNPTLPWKYWLNTPDTLSSELVRYVNLVGNINDGMSDDDICGVRPALKLNLSSGKYVISGKGTKQNPIIMQAK
jgi:hypothetical protein